MTATLTEQITVAGTYDNIPNEVYQADPVPGGSLSHSGARRLLPPSCPALYRWWADHGAARTKAFDLGHVAHRLVLGAGADVEVVEADDWRTKAAREHRDRAHADGAVPLLIADYLVAQEMAAAIRAHPIASALFNPEHGRPEQTLVWQDQRAGIWRRARLDWLPDNRDGRMVVPDYKTTICAAPDELPRIIHNYGYHQQADWYLDGVRSLGLADDAARFVLVLQEKTPPYLVTVAQPTDYALSVGHDLNARAVDIYRQCRETGHWPGYSDDVELIALPPWAEAAHEREYA